MPNPIAVPPNVFSVIINGACDFINFIFCLNKFLLSKKKSARFFLSLFIISLLFFSQFCVGSILSIFLAVDKILSYNCSLFNSMSLLSVADFNQYL